MNFLVYLILCTPAIFLEIVGSMAVVQDQEYPYLRTFKGGLAMLSVAQLYAWFILPRFAVLML